MKLLVLSVLALAALTAACEAGPQRSRGRDSLKKMQIPGVKRLDPDSPRNTRMPLVPVDTARQAGMPVLRPPKNVQPK